MPNDHYTSDTYKIRNELLKSIKTATDLNRVKLALEVAYYNPKLAAACKLLHTQARMTFPQIIKGIGLNMTPENLGAFIKRYAGGVK